VAGISDVNHNVEEEIDHGFYWSESTGIIDLGTFFELSMAFGVDGSGTVVGWTDSNFNNFLTLGFQWTQDRGMRPLSGQMASVGPAQSINDTGQIVGKHWVIYGATTHAYRLSGNRLDDLGTLPGGAQSWANAINSAGQVVGASTVTSRGLNPLAFLWQEDSGMTALGVLPGDSFSEAFAINSSGQVVGRSISLRGENHAFRWTVRGGIQRIGTKPDFPGISECNAVGVNDSGQVVGGASTPNDVGHAFIWTKSSGMRDLNKLIPGNSGFVLTGAWAINNSGQIVGIGYVPDKPWESHAFLLTPVK
jgi:probable HAF family extracellular repeat protein